MVKCQKKTTVYTRVTGYYRPISFFNKGKKEEYKERKVYKVKKSMDNFDEKSKGLE